MIDKSTQLIRVSIRGSDSNKEEVSRLNLDVSRSQTVGETKKMLLDRDGSLAVDELMFNGEPVDDDQILSSFPSSEEESLLFTARRRTLEVRTARRKPRCSFKICNSTPLRGVGDCRNCNGKFCSRHRLMEQHDCAGLQGCKQQLHERNAHRLQQQQTMPNKV
ncbi:Tmc1 protein [Starmerella bacillaris]|uniref:Tmc1 protein n=1 Tax=Starmerella bacillaris TaxID=1247836 RepID=A0AAV5RI15_STABA|nr:Tmc1 protein [Starmerella bacillaris]